MSLAEVHALHLLLTAEPAPGKTLHSILAASRATSQTSPLHTSVEKVVHAAFWADAHKQLLSDDPPAVLDRLKLLLLDVREAILPLFPPSNPILRALPQSAPVPPTTCPLASVKLLLRDVLAAMRQRAAPIRDPFIDGLVADLDISGNSEMALAIVNTVKSVLALADTMKNDLSDFVVGSMTESELRAHLTQQAHERERMMILEIWRESGGKQRIDELWKTWVGAVPSGLSPREGWIRRLVQSCLGSTIPLSCPMPSGEGSIASNTNELPPPFLFSKPELLRAQNQLQALVVAACLRSLIRTPANSNLNDFMPRIWALLEDEIVQQDPSVEGTKLINLADELVRARWEHRTTSDAPEEARLRAAVDRTLQYSDPVLKLLQKRLLDAIAGDLCAERTVVSHPVPARMQTGRSMDLSQNVPTVRQSRPTVKGFEDPFLASAVWETCDKIRGYVEWVDTMWFG
ncbi:hypothetical protein C8F01DRAFT_236452 [Mycena amicta]|nr:hypothetical protein C8F01DRAFT_236452 [Mycena amicta]